MVFFVFNLYGLKEYNDKVLPNTYLEGFDLSDYTYDSSKEKMDYYKDLLLAKTIKLKANNKEYDYALKDLGVSIDVDKSIDQIKKYQNKLKYRDKLKSVNGNSRKEFSLIYNFDSNKLKETIVVVLGTLL